MLRTILLAGALLGACVSDVPEPTAPSALHEIDRDRAVALAIDTGRNQGYDPALYDVREIELETEAGSFQNTWRVFFELKPPGQPGGHFTVYVDKNDGTTRLFHGR